MKIRLGFVSNSSSSSYLITLPKNFSLDTATSPDYISFIKDYLTKNNCKYLIENLNNPYLKEDLEYLLTKGFIESNCYYNGNSGDPVDFNSISTLLSPYSKSIEGPPDSPSYIILLDTSRASKSLNSIKTSKK